MKQVRSLINYLKEERKREYSGEDFALILDDLVIAAEQEVEGVRCKNCQFYWNRDNNRGLCNSEKVRELCEHATGTAAPYSGMDFKPDFGCIFFEKRGE